MDLLHEDKYKHGQQQSAICAQVSESMDVSHEEKGKHGR